MVLAGVRGEFPLISEIDLNTPLPFCDTCNVVACSVLVTIKSKSWLAPKTIEDAPYSTIPKTQSRVCYCCFLRVLRLSCLCQYVQMHRGARCAHEYGGQRSVESFFLSYSPLWEVCLVELGVQQFDQAGWPLSSSDLPVSRPSRSRVTDSDL